MINALSSAVRDLVQTTKQVRFQPFIQNYKHIVNYLHKLIVGVLIVSKVKICCCGLLM